MSTTETTDLSQEFASDPRRAFFSEEQGRWVRDGSFEPLDVIYEVLGETTVDLRSPNNVETSSSKETYTGHEYADRDAAVEYARAVARRRAEESDERTVTEMPDGASWSLRFADHPSLVIDKRGAVTVVARRVTPKQAPAFTVIDTVTPSGWRVSTGEFVQHGHLVTELFEHGGFPVMIHDGGYPYLVNADGRGTSHDKGAAPHISIALFGTETTFGDGRVERSWREAVITACGAFVHSRRRELRITVEAQDPNDRAALVARAKQELDRAVEMLSTIDARYEAAAARIAEGAPFEHPMDRAAYEAACTTLGVEARSDDTCLSATISGNYSFPHYTADQVLSMDIAFWRGKAIATERESAKRAAREAQDREVAANPAPRRAWGAGGVRYNERCARCRKVGDIDNDTELCQSCGGR